MTTDLQQVMERLKYNVVISCTGTERWYLNDELHREDGPAVIYANGTQLWFRNGQLHREDGPAIIWADGSREWFRNGCGLIGDCLNDN
jgi:hypothetical protein